MTVGRYGDDGSHTDETRQVVTAFHAMQDQAAEPLTAEAMTAAYREVLASNVRFECMGRHPVGGVFQGVDEFIEKFLTPAMRLLTDVQVTVDEIFCEGERAVVLFHNKSTGPTGLPYNNHYCVIYRVQERKIVEAVEYLDTELTHTAMFGMPYPCQEGHVCIGRT